MAQYGLSKEKVVVIRWGSVFDAYQPPTAEQRAAAMRKFSLDGDFFVYPAVTWPHKNHEDILRAAHLLKSRYGRTVQIIFTGAQTDYRRTLDELAGQLEVADKVRYLGFVTAEELQSIFNAATAMVFPSKFEGFRPADSGGFPYAASGSFFECKCASGSGARCSPVFHSRLSQRARRADDADVRWISAELRVKRLVERGEAILSTFSLKDMAKSFQRLYADAAAIAALQKQDCANDEQGLTAVEPNGKQGSMIGVTKRRALICGISGQDGSYLARLLLDRGYEVWGSSRDAELNSFANLRRLAIYEKVNLVSLNPGDIGGMLGLLRRVRPDEVFSLAGQSSVGLSFEQPVETMESIALATLNLLEAIRLSDLPARFYNAGSTECFGDTGDGCATEGLAVCSPALSTLSRRRSAYWMVANYRQAYGIFACTGILSNHDSPLRPRRFVTRKIVHAAALLVNGGDGRLSLGNLSVERDWGWAPDYVEAIAAMLQQKEPQDFTIATGKSYPLIEFVETAFRLVGKDWREFVTVDETLLRPTDIVRNKVNPSKAANLLGWRAAYSMHDVVAKMLESEIADLAKGEAAS